MATADPRERARADQAARAEQAAERLRQRGRKPRSSGTFCRRFAGVGAACFVGLLAWALAQPKARNLRLPEQCHGAFPLQAPVDFGTSKFAGQVKAKKPWPPPAVGSAGGKAFDLVVLGATGFTGRLVADYLASKPDLSDLPVRWAVAGRSEAKLRALRAALQTNSEARDPTTKGGSVQHSPPAAHLVDYLVVDSSDPESVEALAEATRVVVTTVGPYTEHGELLLATCARMGVDYVDLSGEPFWQREMIDKYEGVARASGARILIAGGYDSVPFDLGALLAWDVLERRHGATPSAITSLVTTSRGWLSGGTLASAVKTFKAVASGAVSPSAAKDPHLLQPPDDPGVHGACRPNSEVGSWLASWRASDVSGWSGLGAAPQILAQLLVQLPRFDEDARGLGIPHFMAVINARVVRRSLTLRGLRDCTYAEGISLGALVDACFFMSNLVARGAMPLRDLVPSPSRGPSKAVLETGSARVEVTASFDPSHRPAAPGALPAGPAASATVAVAFLGDPGYNATAKMVAEVGLCLALGPLGCPPDLDYEEAGVVPRAAGAAPHRTAERPQWPSPVDSKNGVPQGGVTTAAAALGFGLLERLAKVDDGKFMTFQVLDKPGA